MSSIRLDTKDRKILNALQNNGRISNADLAESIHLSPSSCLRRVKYLEKNQVISGYRAILNPDAIGRSNCVFVHITLTSQSEDVLEEFEIAVASCQDVRECHLMTGRADYILRIHVADIADYANIHKTQLSRLPNIATIQSSFILRTICKWDTYIL